MAAAGSAAAGFGLRLGEQPRLGMRCCRWIGGGQHPDRRGCGSDLQPRHVTMAVRLRPDIRQLDLVEIDELNGLRQTQRPQSSKPVLGSSTLAQGRHKF